jgi:hypothetical protein
MRCRHTVPDWHRYIVSGAETPPIFVACRLLVREGDPASDSRTIACSYWRHQEDCPVYDGPVGQGGDSAEDQVLPNPRAIHADLPLAGEEPWPVRPPGAPDSLRWYVIGLGLLSVLLLIWAGAVGLWAMRGMASPVRVSVITLVAATVSIATHILATLRTWARR